MAETELREELYASFKNRAMIYHQLFEVLREELDEERAASCDLCAGCWAAPSTGVGSS
ncbi:MAG: hypothetical protein KGZ60_14340 [Truepera sp.]|nr:hypothetical protein [Truepera sp.]